MSIEPLIERREGAAHLAVLGTQVRFLCEGHHTRGTFSMMEVMLPVDAGPPPHHHDWDEAYYIADGEVRFTLGDRVLDVRAGDFVYAPAGTVHGFHGRSETPARVLILDAPAHASGFFRAVDREVRAMPEDGHKVPTIGLAHGIHFLPPG